MSDSFPFTGASDDLLATTIDDSDLPVLNEYAWDFEQDKFLYDGNGNHIMVTENKALEVWIYKALKTERFQYLAYSWNYGIELKPFIGKVMGVQERYSELKRAIVECLMSNAYIVSIDTIDFTAESAKVTCTVTLTSVYGELIVNV